MATIEQQLAQLSDQDLQALKQSLLKGKRQETGRGLFRAARGFGEGALAGLQGTPVGDIPVLQEKEDTSAKDIETFRAKERIKAEIKKEFKDPDTAGLQIINLPGGGFAVVPGGAKGAVSPDLTGKVDAQGKPIELEDITIKSGGVTGKVPKTPEQRETEAIEGGIKKGVEEAFKQAEGLKRALKKVNSITRQFNEALPSDFPPIVQRFRGFLAGIGAETGLAPNPKLLALKRTAKLQLRAILRDMGEGARLSDQDITQNIALIEQEGLTNGEREALVSTYMQTAVDSMDFRTLRVLQDDPGVLAMFEDLGVQLASEDGQRTTQPTPQEIDDAERRGAVGFDTDRGVFVDSNGNEI
ncbi:MAG TPA: hypothetical protein ENI23_06490 [bacterium]|nr:hypothetical protein [bacterium]